MCQSIKHTTSIAGARQTKASTLGFLCLSSACVGFLHHQPQQRPEKWIAASHTAAHSPDHNPNNHPSHIGQHGLDLDHPPITSMAASTTAAAAGRHAHGAHAPAATASTTVAAAAAAAAPAAAARVTVTATATAPVHPYKEVLAGSVAAVASTLVCHPIDVLRTELQTQARATTARECLRRIGGWPKWPVNQSTVEQPREPAIEWSDRLTRTTIKITVGAEGAAGLYKGLSAPLAAQAVYKA
jgi:hypothetical protein